MRRPRSRCGKKPKTHNLARTLKRMKAKEQPRGTFDFETWSKAMVPMISQVIAQAPVISDLFKTSPTIPLDTVYETNQNRPLVP